MFQLVMQIELGSSHCCTEPLRLYIENVLSATSVDTSVTAIE